MQQVLSPHSDSLQYGGRVFRTSSSFLRRVVPGSAADDTRANRTPLIMGPAATAVLLARLPKLSVSLTDSPAGMRLREHFSDRIYGILHSRLLQGVLVLPVEQSEYLRGRSRRALRTSIHKARAAGVACRPLHRLDERRAATVHLRARVADMLQWDDELFCAPGDTWWSACAPECETVALAQVTVDREWAMLRSFVSTDRASRFLLHAELMNMLIEAKVRYLVASAPMAPLLEPSLQYWQRLLGFQVFNLRLCEEPLATANAQVISHVEVPRGELVLRSDEQQERQGQERTPPRVGTLQS